MRSLEVLRAFVVKCNNPRLCLLPAHGDVITDAVAKIDEYLVIRRKQVNKVKTGLMSNPEGTWVSEKALIGQIYPASCDNPMKYMIAVNSLRQALFYLQCGDDAAICSGLTVAQPITAAGGAPRGEGDFKRATSVVRPGHLPESFNEEWLWQWLSPSLDTSNGDNARQEQQ